MTRKRYIESLETRTPEQIAEEEALYIEVRRLEQNERKFKRERENLLRTIAGMDSGLPDITEDDPIASGVITTGDVAFKVVKKKRGSLDESPATPSTATISAVKRPNTTKSAVYGKVYFLANFVLLNEIFSDAQNCIIRTDVPASALATKAAHQPAYPRSFKIPAPKAALTPKINQALAELGISSSRLVMPTRDNVAQLEALIDATTHLVETKRLVDKTEYDISVLRKRLELHDEDGNGDASGSVMEIEDSQTGADAEGETEDETGGGAESVVSVRSGRGNRKKVREFPWLIIAMLKSCHRHDGQYQFPQLIQLQREQVRKGRNEIDRIEKYG